MRVVYRLVVSGLLDCNSKLPPAVAWLLRLSYPIPSKNVIVLTVSECITSIGDWPGTREKVYYAEKHIKQDRINKIPLQYVMLAFFCLFVFG